jgi:hypothetical protein
VTTPIDADLLMAFIASEADERQSAFKDTDTPVERASDLAYIEALEVVAQYIVAAVGRRAA